MLEQIRSSVIVAAKAFNPSIITQLWLANKKLITEEDLLPGSVYTDDVSQTVSKRFNLVVIPPQLQFAPKVPEVEWKGITLEIVGRIVETLPETPYLGMGFNFTVDFVPANETVIDLERRLFFRFDSPIAKQFSETSSRFGGYFSKDFHGGRMRVDIKPAVASMEGQKEDRVRLDFNFHRDVVRGVADLTDHFTNWDFAQAFVHSTIGDLKK